MLEEGTARFLNTVGAALSRGDRAAALALLARDWPLPRLVDLLASPSPTVVIHAATCVGYVGSPQHSCYLVPLLSHANRSVVAAAESALWHLWMQGPDAAATAGLHAALQRVRAADLHGALDLLNAVNQAAPDFAEPLHQRGLVLQELGQPEAARIAYVDAARLNPWHFAALAAIGHVCVELSEYTRALLYYRKALDIHPNLSELLEIVPQLESAIQRRVVA